MNFSGRAMGVACGRMHVYFSHFIHCLLLCCCAQNRITRCSVALDVTFFHDFLPGLATRVEQVIVVLQVSSDVWVGWASGPLSTLNMKIPAPQAIYRINSSFLASKFDTLGIELEWQAWPWSSWRVGCKSMIEQSRRFPPDAHFKLCIPRKMSDAPSPLAPSFEPRQAFYLPGSAPKIPHRRVIVPFISKASMEHTHYFCPIRRGEPGPRATYWPSEREILFPILQSHR